MDLSKIIWKDLKGYEGYYSVSNTGEVKSISRTVECKNGTLRFIKERLLSQKTRKDGYKQVQLSKGAKAKSFLVHRLVAECFLPIKANKPLVNHIDGIKSNNKLNNLEWCDDFENARHAVVNGLSGNIGESCNFNVLKEYQVYEIKEYLKEGILTQRKIAELYNVHYATISAINVGKSWKYVK